MHCNTFNLLWPSDIIWHHPTWSYPWYEFENYQLNVTSTSPRGLWVKMFVSIFLRSLDNKKYSHGLHLILFGFGLISVNFTHILQGCFTVIEVMHTISLLSMKQLWSWWHYQMETFSTLLALCAGNSPVTSEFPSQRPVTRSLDVFFDLRLNKGFA